MSIVTEIVGILTSGISGVATGIGSGLSTLAQSIFLTGTGDTQMLSTFGTLIVVFAAIPYALQTTRAKKK